MHSTLTQATQTLTPWFRETDRGLELTDPQAKPPLKAYEAQALKLRGEEVGWQIKVGDLAASLRKDYPQAYQQVLEMCGLAGYHRSLLTIEGWASACRSVPMGSRNGLSISFLQVVAPLTDPLDQKEWLDYALKNGLSVASFRHHVSAFRGISEPLQAPPWEERDTKLFEAEKTAYELEVALQEERTARRRAEVKVSQLAPLREQVEALLGMKPTDLLVNINQVIAVLKEVLEALVKLGIDK